LFFVPLAGLPVILFAGLSWAGRRVYRFCPSAGWPCHLPPDGGVIQSFVPLRGTSFIVLRPFPNSSIRRSWNLPPDTLL